MKSLTLLSLVLFVAGCEPPQPPDRWVQVNGRGVDWCHDLSRAQRQRIHDELWAHPTTDYKNDEKILGQMMCFDELGHP